MAPPKRASALESEALAGAVGIGSSADCSDKVYEMNSAVLHFCVAFQFDGLAKVTNRMLAMRIFGVARNV